ncbi:hypothetical protein HZ326_16429 [Fusarium oxysporum f. sp. albedinis]|nr:hypothetical protein HZ326_16429 [Fusarium oxysporum f. sp. albedinis]
MNNVILSACRCSDTKKHVAWRENQMMREILTIVVDLSFLCSCIHDSFFAFSRAPGPSRSSATIPTPTPYSLPWVAWWMMLENSDILLFKLQTSNFVYLLTSL